VRDLQIVAESPVRQAFVADGTNGRVEQRWRDPRDRALSAEHPAELPLVPGAEGSVTPQRGFTLCPAFQNATQLAATRNAEVEGRANALGGKRQAMAGRVAHEEDAVARRVAQLVRNPVALVTDGVAAQSVGEADRGLLYMETRIE
jgi:hypothetical protein